ncbi:MAG: hypothetical protein FJW95_02855 [Actinobacteria bacterium]|nr:hypothetical protein [Actinomycetota bacterium]
MLPPLPPLPSAYVSTRDDLHRVATHVLAQKRFVASGRFGLRVTPGGFGTPLFGDAEQEELLRVAGSTLVREHRDADGPRTTVVPLSGATLAEVAAVVAVDLDPTFSVGKDTPPLGDVDALLTVDPDAVAAMAAILTLGAVALDSTLARLGPDSTPIVAQVWPEHFDLGLDVGVGAQRVNLGASVGDRYHADPYVYVGPWNAERPGDPAYWNVGFGALLGYAVLAAAADPVAATVAFFETGLGLLA